MMNMLLIGIFLVLTAGIVTILYLLKKGDGDSVSSDSARYYRKL